MILVILGAPGAGKGTQAKRIKEKFGVAHISTGDILREELKKNTDLGKKANEFMKKGELVPDDLIMKLIKNIINNDNSCKSTGFLMDGFPRTINQAQKFDEMLEDLGLSMHKVINIVVGEDELVKRLSGRRVCRSCNNICSIHDKDNRELILEGKCPECGGDVYQRKDDDREVILQRLEVYNNQTRPLIDYYEDKNILASINGSGSEEKIFERILSTL